MGDNTFNIFKKEISFDEDTSAVYIRDHDLVIHMDITRHPEEQTDSWADMEEIEKGRYLIHFNNLNRPVKELMFDFYHEVGKILIYLDKLDTRDVFDWLDEEYIDVSNNEFIASELAADKYAFDKIGYKGTIKRLIPLRKASEIVHRNPTIELSVIRSSCLRNNRERAIRRRYLEYLSDINQSSEKKGNQIGNAEWRALSNRPKNPNDKYISIFYDKSQSKKEISVETNLMIFCKKNNITYTKKESFSELCKRIVKYFSNEENESRSDSFTRYKKLVDEFLDPWYKMYNNKVSVKDRKEIEYVIDNVILKHLSDGLVPSQMEINNLISNYRGTSNLGVDVKKATATLLSHKDKVAQCKNTHPQKKYESDEEYSERINNLVFSGKWNKT